MIPSHGHCRYQLKALQESIDRAQGLVSKKITQTERDVIRKREESFDWLCSLADNAIIAADSEVMLKKLSDGLDHAEKQGLEG